jgi:hypothetical protein
MRHAFPVLMLAGPILAVGIWLAIIAGGERAGRRPFAGEPLRNSAEAAAAADPAAMLRFIRAGDDPTRIHAVRPGLISSQILKATTVEAAMWSRRVEMIRLLDRERAIVGDAQRRELACLAADLDMPDVVAYLAPDVQCERGVAVREIVRRSTPEAAPGNDESARSAAERP